MCPVVSKDALPNLLCWDLVVFVLSRQFNSRQTLYIAQGPAQKGPGTPCQQGLSGICTVPKVTGSARGEQEDCAAVLSPAQPKCAIRALWLSRALLSRQLHQPWVLRSPGPEVWIDHLQQEQKLIHLEMPQAH